MRKAYFADVNEYERSGRLKIPPMPDPKPFPTVSLLAAPNPAA